jgi:tRNA-Thr(GGU) m(6)t(6)A37 methyltransferase TsaA
MVIKMKITYSPIGIIHSPFKEPKGTPIQPNAAKDIEGMVEIFPEYQRGLKDINGFSHIVLIYHFHLSKNYSLEVKPYMDDNLHGLFATRAPARPNPIGLSVVRLIKVEKNKLYIQDIDVVDGTPLLDLKPFVPEFNSQDIMKIGWLEKNIKKLGNTKDDGRFRG